MAFYGTSADVNSNFDFSNAAELKLINANGDSRDRFGVSVSISGQYVVVGASDSSPHNSQLTGSAYIYTNVSTNSSNVPIEVYPPTEGLRQEFGSATAVWESTIFIGAPKYNLFTGAVYVYNRVDGAWSMQQFLQASDRSRGDYFGISIAASEHFLVVGANQKNALKGAVYVIANMNTGYEEKTIIEPQDTHEYQKFGHDVCIADTFIAVGAVGDNSKSLYSHGAVYVYERVSWKLNDGTSIKNWTQLAKLYANTPRDLSNFGASVAISRHLSYLNDPFLYTLAVGADNDEVSGVLGAGAVYIFLVKPGSITYVHRAVASNAMSDAQFGYSIDINSGHILVGAPGLGSKAGGAESGAAYLFEIASSANKWVEKKVFFANDTRPYSRFGIAVSIYEGTALVGADQGYGATDNSGCAYLFSPDFAKKSKDRGPLFWSSNPEEDILIILTILPFAVLLIPIFVFSCVYGLNSQWSYIEAALHGVGALFKPIDPEAYDIEHADNSSRGLMGSESTHSATALSEVLVLILLRLIIQ